MACLHSENEALTKGEEKMRECKRSCFSTWVFLGGSLLLLLTACGSNNTTGGGQTNDPTPTSGQRTPLSLDFICHDNPAGGFYVNRSYGRVCVQTAPGAALTIAVKFCNGAPDPSNELKGTVYADSQGYYEWNWKPQPDCQGHPIWKGDVVVHAQLRGQSASFTTSFFGD